MPVNNASKLSIIAVDAPHSALNAEPSKCRSPYDNSREAATQMHSVAETISPLPLFSMRPEKPIEKKPSAAAPTRANVLSPGDALTNGRFTIECMIGGGGFGQVYTATDKKQPNVTVIVKTGHQTCEKDTARMFLEIDVMRLVVMGGGKQVPHLYACGQVNSYNFIVMQMLSKSLTDVRRGSPPMRLTMSTSLRLWQQMLTAIHDVHDIGYLHRDIKPSNMTMGLTPATAHTLYLIDFGLVRKFVDAADNTKMRKERRKAGFRGTTRYVSTRVHDRREQCRGDDLYSLFYTTIELMSGNLPWRIIKDHDKIKEAKLAFNVPKVCPGTPKAFIDIMPLIAALGYGDRPDYEHYHNMTEEALKQVNASHKDPFDWEVPGWASVMREVREGEKTGQVARKTEKRLSQREKKHKVDKK